MDWFKIVKDNYDKGYYTAEQVAVFVQKGKIMAQQYEEITGQPYAA